MKPYLLYVLVLFAFQSSFSQGTYTEVQRKKDKAKLDSICKKSPSTCLYYGDVMGVNSIFRKYQPKKIDRNQRICFNKKFQYMATINGKTSRGCFYINTTTGYVAMFMSNLDNSCQGMESPKPGFDMMIVSKIGESFIYRISKKGKKTFLAQMPPDDIPYGRPTHFVLKNPNALRLPFREPFTSENLPTLPYKIEGSESSSSRYLFGGYHAQRIPLKDYIGAFGLGYYKDGMNNTFICLASESKDTFVKVEKIEDVNACFDGRDYGDSMQEAINSNDDSFKEEEEKLNKEASDERTKNCEATAALIAHKRQILAKEKNFNDFIKNGGNMNSKEGQKLGANAQDVIDQVITHRLETEKRICDQEYSIYLAAENNNNKRKANAQKKKDCFLIAVQQFKELQQELVRIDAKCGTNYGKALGEKSVLYFKRMKDINSDCNQDRDGNIKKNPMDAGADKLGEELQKIMKGN